MDASRRPLVVTGQQIGVGWTPALSVVKALAALAWARKLGGEARYWLADEDHDREEVSRTCAWQGQRIVRQRFVFDAPPNIAAGWLPWTQAHQAQAQAIWGELPEATEPTLRGHVLATGLPLWRLGIQPFVPTAPTARAAIQEELLRWRTLDLPSALIRQAEHLEARGTPLVLDPRQQASWFSLDPRTGLRLRLEPGDPLPANHWLSPGAALRPLMQSLMLPCTHVVLGPAERAYWALTEPLWERVGLTPPAILNRPSVFVVPRGLDLTPARLSVLRDGHWRDFRDAMMENASALPSRALDGVRPDPAWGQDVGRRFQQELARLQQRLSKLDRRVERDGVAKLLGEDPERIRQHLFPFQRDQERIMPGVLWMKNSALLEAILQAMPAATSQLLLEEPSTP